MTARAMLLREIQRYYVDRENVTPSHYGMGMDSRGEYVLYADHEAERNRLLDEIERMKLELAASKDNFDTARDEILHLGEDDGLDNDAVNVVLGILDDTFSTPIPLPETKGDTE